MGNKGKGKRCSSGEAGGWWGKLDEWCYFDWQRLGNGRKGHERVGRVGSSCQFSIDHCRCFRC